MALQKKILRYYYWLILEFIKKHIRIIVISFVLSFLLIIGIISVFPYINTFFLEKKEIIGFAGQYDFKNIPDEISVKISNSLVYINEKNEILPALATTWEQKNQGKTYRFHIRNNLLWSDGKPFTASDVNYNFNDVETKVIDSYTLDFNLKKPLSIFPSYLTKPIIKYPLQGIAGLYRVNRLKMKYDRISEISLAPNKKDLPVLIYRFYENENKLVNAYKMGEISIFKTSRPNVADFFGNWKNTKITKIVDYSQVLTLFFNMTSELFKENPDLRNAMITAIPVQDFTNQGEAATGPITPISWAHNPDLKKRIYDFDKAQKIIEKYMDASKSASLNFLADYEYWDMAEAIVAALKSAGLKINLKLLSFNKKNNFDLVLAFWKIPSDPDQYYFWHSTQTQGNITGYNKPKIDKLLEDGRNTFVTKERIQYYQKFQEIFVDDPPAAFLYYPYIYEVKRK